MAHHCRIGLLRVCDVYADPVRREYIAEMIIAGAEPSTVVNRLTADLETEDLLTLRGEFESLPKAFMQTFMALWVEAETHDLTFVIESVSPGTAGPSMARAGKVSWGIEADGDGFRMTVSHVPGHHADWMTKTPELAATS